MKRIVISAGFIMACLAFFGLDLASAGVQFSRHDFSFDTGGSLVFKSTNETQVCIFCHTPHGGIATNTADGTGQRLPLWNRTLNYGTSFTMYDSDTFNGKSSYINSKPTGMSLLCLSCHDGVNAVSNVNNINTVINYSPNGSIQMPGSNNVGDVTAPPYRDPNIGNDLSNDHPVSFIYNTSTASTDGGLYDPGLKGAGLSTPLPLYGADLASQRLECSTCHDPHEDGSLTNQAPFLRMTNAGSQMCMNCHNK